METYDVRVIDEMTGDVLITFYSLDKRQLDDLRTNIDVMQAVEIIN